MEHRELFGYFKQGFLKDSQSSLSPVREQWFGLIWRILRILHRSFPPENMWIQPDLKPSKYSL